MTQASPASPAIGDAPPTITSPVADPQAAHAHFSNRLAVETDVADVAAALAAGEPDFVLVDARSEASYANGHVPGAISLPHARITAETVAELPEGLVVAYCWGPSCNGATKAAVRLAALGRPVKEMLGGFEYWERDGHPVERTPAAPR
jgi:rhodanese-related sulfurtransferase